MNIDYYTKKKQDKLKENLEYKSTDKWTLAFAL